MNAWFRLLTPPPSGAGAIAAIAIGGDVDGVLRAIRAGPVGIGDVVLRELAGIDRGLVARWGTESATVMPHAGPQVVRELMGELHRLGARAESSSDWRQAYPEARDEIEARMLGTLARAASPIAIGLLLEQPARWRAWRANGGGDDAALAARSVILNRLIDPPLVVAVGRPNIGKSTLVNALAGRCVAIAVDEPGTTRDHVGVQLDLKGLVVRWVDTPGLRTGGADVELEAQAIAVRLAERADLVVLCRDAGEPYPEWRDGAQVVRVALRRDRGRSPEPVDVQVSATTGEGMVELVECIRERLVPGAVLGDAGPWRFDEGPMP